MSFPNTLAAARLDGGAGAYPERHDARDDALDEWTRAAVGHVSRRARPFEGRIRGLVKAVEGLAAEVTALDDDVICREVRLHAPQALARVDEAARVFALAREAASRVLGLKPFETQIMGAAALLGGRLCEMQTGEGKTLTAALAACIAAAAGVPVHVVTVNDYLAARDAEEMGPLYRFFGLTAGAVVSGMSPDARREAYACDVTYCTNKELVFDYLKDRVAVGGRVSHARLKIRNLHEGKGQTGLLLRGLHFAIVDEADSVLIDEARTPLILARQSDREGDAGVYAEALALAEKLEIGRHFKIQDARKEVHLTDPAKANLAETAGELGGIWRAPQAREHLVVQALRALHLFRRDQHYVIIEDKVQIVDEYTGRVLPGRTWEHGLHQLIEVKEGCAVSGRTGTLARITYQRFFRRYMRLAGMTGTAREVSREIRKIYRLEMMEIPTHRPCARLHQPAVYCKTEGEKWQRVADMAKALQAQGRPVLIGTRSVNASERLSEVLSSGGVSHRVLNARQDANEAAIIAQAGQRGVVTVATNMAGRGTDIRLGVGAAELGGLQVILTEFHDSPRIDRQFVGRCARQGDPGAAAAIVAVDDPLFREHGGLFCKLLELPFSRVLPRFWLGLMRKRAQNSAQRYYARVRKATLKQDEALDRMLAFSGKQP